MKNQYAKFLLTQQKAAIATKVTLERQNAAKEATWLAVVAMNETEGINVGRERLLRFVDTLVAITDEYGDARRKDPEYAYAKLMERVDRILDRGATE